MKKEYGIYCRVNNACPYIAQVYSNMKEVEEYFRTVSVNHDRYHRLYYIDAEGFRNKYPKELATFYYKLVERPVNDWQEIA